MGGARPPRCAQHRLSPCWHPETPAPVSAAEADPTLSLSQRALRDADATSLSSAVRIAAARLESERLGSVERLFTLSLLVAVQTTAFAGGLASPKTAALWAVTNTPSAKVAAPQVSDDMEGLPSTSGPIPNERYNAREWAYLNVLRLTGAAPRPTPTDHQTHTTNTSLLERNCPMGLFGTLQPDGSLDFFVSRDIARHYPGGDATNKKAPQKRARVLEVESAARVTPPS